MKLTRFDTNLSNIQNLPDTPTIDADELKKTFDKSGLDTQNFINDTLLPEIEEKVPEEVEPIREEINKVNQKLLDSGWISLEYASSFKPYNNGDYNKPKYRIVGDLVQIKGIATPAKDIEGSSEQVTMFTIPQEIAPQMAEYRICQGSYQNRWLLSIATNGNVTFSRYARSEDYDTCEIENWLPFSCVYFKG